MANIGLDPLFMFVLDLGVVGVAVATVVVQGGVVAWLLFKVLRLDLPTFLSAATLQGLRRPEIVMHFNIVRQVIGQLFLFWLFWVAVEVIGSDITGIWWSVLIVNWVLAVAIVVVVRRFLADLENLERSRNTLLAPDPDSAPDLEPAE